MPQEGGNPHLSGNGLLLDVRTLFDHNIPAEINERFIHFLSNRPCFVYPQCYVETSDVLSVFGASKELHSAALTQFCKVTAHRAGTGKDQYQYHDVLMYDNDSLSPGLYVRDEASLSPLLSRLAGCLVEAGCTPLNELDLSSIGVEFPLDGLLEPCSALRQLSLHFSVDNVAIRHHLECVSERASQITDLELSNVKGLGGCPHVWPRLKWLKKLKVSFQRTEPLDPTETIFDRIAHPNSQLCSLTLSGFKDIDQLFAALHLCQEIGHRLVDFDVDIEDLSLSNNTVLTKFGQFKEAYPQVAVRLPCGDKLLPVMQALRDSLVGMSCDLTNMTTSNGLADSAASCTKLKSIRIAYISPCQGEALELLLSRVGRGLRVLELMLIPDPDSGEAAVPPQRYIECVARYTGKLHFFKMGCKLPKLSYRPIAIANHELRGLLLDFGIEHVNLDINLHDSEKLVARTVDDFLANCLHLVDVEIFGTLHVDDEDKALKPLFQERPGSTG